MAVLPQQLQGVIPHHVRADQFIRLRRSEQEHVRVGRAAHVGVAALALGARACRPQTVKRIFTLVPVVPGKD